MLVAAGPGKEYQEPKAIPFTKPLRDQINKGVKTTTRRPMRHQPHYAAMTQAGLMVSDYPIKKGTGGLVVTRKGSVTTWPHLPYRPGQILYVPEPWKCVKAKDREYTVQFQDGEEVTFHFDETSRAIRWGKYADKPKNRWQSPYFMPKEAARMFLEVQTVDVERLMDITEAGARAEGLQSRAEFLDVWIKLYGDLVRANPWGWVIAFKKLNLDQIIFSDPFALATVPINKS